MSTKNHDFQEVNLPLHVRVHAQRSRAPVAQGSAGEYASSRARVAPLCAQKRCEQKEKSSWWALWRGTIDKENCRIYMQDLPRGLLGICGASRICQERSSWARVLLTRLHKGNTRQKVPRKSGNRKSSWPGTAKQDNCRILTQRWNEGNI